MGTARLRPARSTRPKFRLRRADGVYRWHLVRALPIRRGRAKTAAILRWVGTNTDIEEQKAAAAALAHLNATLEQQVAQRTADRDRMWRLSTDIMLVADFDGTITAVNPAWSALFGWAETELLGRDFMTLVHPDDWATTLAEIDALSQGRSTSRFENRYRAKDGSYRLHLLDRGARGRAHPRRRPRHHRGTGGRTRARPDAGTSRPS